LFSNQLAAALLAACVLSAAVAQPIAQERKAGRILEAAGIKGGLIVHIGCGDGELTAGLRANDSYVVQGLDTDAGRVEKARETIASEGLYGKVTVREFDGRNLPYIDNLVNLVVATGKCNVSEDEMLRVLAPRGVAYINGKKTINGRQGPGGRSASQDTMDRRAEVAAQSRFHVEYARDGFGSREDILCNRRRASESYLSALEVDAHST